LSRVPDLTSTTLPAESAFAEPWQARAFALAIKLADRGHFTSREWTAALSREIGKTAAASATIDDGSHYYEHWLTALETLAVEKGLTDTIALQARKEAWRDAYHRTPHGKPVELTSDHDSLR
jgi:nitrile hydratase accessory protein